MSISSDRWPVLPLNAWRDTYATVHMWTQMVGKVRMALAPPVNHWWHTTLYVTARGLGTSPIPSAGGVFEIEFDFVEHALRIRCEDGRSGGFALGPMSVAEFHGALMAALRGLGIEASIWPVPVEVPNPIRFTEDRRRGYDREQVHRCWEILVRTDAVFKEFRGRYLGKCSPVHFFWGAFDLAVTRFSGRPAPKRDVDHVQQEAYSHEVISHGFWPGGAWPGAGDVDAPIYYSYTAPEPAGIRQARIGPKPAEFSAVLGEFVLPYDAVRESASPRAALLEFMESTYEAGAKAAGWDRGALERR